MEWRDVPGYPGYQVSERGRLRKSSGYELARRGPRFVLSRGGVLTRLTPAELIALAWPPSAPEQAHPEAPEPAPEPAPEATPPAEPEHPAIPAEPAPTKTTGREMPEGFVPVPGSGGYRINRAGELINSRGKQLRRHRNNFYSLGRTDVSVSRLLDLTFGAGAAVAAGFPAPRSVEMVDMQDYGIPCQRRCHDCGRPTNNYRCDACWALLRGGGDMEESEWNAL